MSTLCLPLSRDKMYQALPLLSQESLGRDNNKLMLVKNRNQDCKHVMILPLTSAHDKMYQALPNLIAGRAWKQTCYDFRRKQTRGGGGGGGGDSCKAKPDII